MSFFVVSDESCCCYRFTLCIVVAAADYVAAVVVRKILVPFIPEGGTTQTPPTTCLLQLKKRQGGAGRQGRHREANPPVSANLKASLDTHPADPARRLRSPPTGEMSWVISDYSAIPPEQRPSGQFLPFRADDRTRRDVH